MTSNFTRILATAAICFPVCSAYAATEDGKVMDKTVHAADFGAFPDDGKDDTKALRRAAEYCRRHPGCTLSISPGIYILKDSMAERLKSEVMSGDMGQNPEETIFTPYYPYVKGMDFSGSESVTGCCNFTLKGRIVFEGCYFKAQGDDATNVHGYYHNISSVSDDGWITLELRSPTFTHSQTADVPRTGDKLEVSPVSTIVPEFTATVTDVSHQEKSTSVRIRIDRELPENYSDFYVFNISRLPELVFRNSMVWGNLSRAVLAKTMGVLIERNTFIGCTGTAVHIGAESWWKEGSHTTGATIRDNVIVNCGTGAGSKYPETLSETACTT